MLEDPTKLVELLSYKVTVLSLEHLDYGLVQILTIHPSSSELNNNSVTLIIQTLMISHALLSEKYIQVNRMIGTTTI